MIRFLVKFLPYRTILTFSSHHKASSQTEVAALRRELRLMSSAWYDMTSRLQSGNVVLQRRPDPPKSFIARQRIIVNSSGSVSWLYHPWVAPIPLLSWCTL